MIPPDASSKAPQNKNLGNASLLCCTTGCTSDSPVASSIHTGCPQLSIAADSAARIVDTKKCKTSEAIEDVVDNSDSAILQYIVAAWPLLSDRVRQAILTLVELDSSFGDQPESSRSRHAKASPDRGVQSDDS